MSRVERRFRPGPEPLARCGTDTPVRVRPQVAFSEPEGRGSTPRHTDKSVCATVAWLLYSSWEAASALWHTAQKVAACVLFLALLTIVSACRGDQKMAQQPSFKPYEETSFFENRMSARLPVEGTVARGSVSDDLHRSTGKMNGILVTQFPFAVTAQVMQRGRERYDIHCSMCHGRDGYGGGMVVMRGYSKPPSLHIVRLREMPVGHYFDVVTNGYGAMPAYRAQVPVDDRWAIAAYIRALQLSQNATINEVPAAKRAELQRTGMSR